MKNKFGLFLILIQIFTSSSSWGFECNTEQNALVKYERALLESGSELPENEDKFKEQVKEPLTCLLNLYLKSEGFSKVVAANTLRPFLGGPLTEGMPADERYKKIFLALKEQALLTPSFAHALGETHAAATWEFYKLFCEENETEKNIYCAEMLPPADLISNQEVFESVSSILLMRKAYYKLEGQINAQRKVADKIREIRKKISNENRIERALIDEIYNEIFTQKKIPLSRV